MKVWKPFLTPRFFCFFILRNHNLLNITISTTRKEKIEWNWILFFHYFPSFFAKCVFNESSKMVKQFSVAGSIEVELNSGCVDDCIICTNRKLTLFHFLPAEPATSKKKKPIFEQILNLNLPRKILLGGWQRTHRKIYCWDYCLYCGIDEKKNNILSANKLFETKWSKASLYC